MKVINKESLAKGNKGVEFCKEYFKEKFIQATVEEDITQGIDCFIDGKAVDVKNTQEVFFAQINKTNHTFSIRHPFKSSTKATHYCFVKVEDKIEEGELVELIEVKEKILQFIKDEMYDNFLTRLQMFDNKGTKELGVSFSQAAYQFKTMLLPYLKEGISVKYLENSSDYSFTFYKLKKKEQKVESTTTTNVTSILDKYKNKEVTISKPINTKEAIIKVKI